MAWWWISALIGAYILFDAHSRTKGQGWAFIWWGLGVLLFCPLICPIYMAKRPLKEGEKREGGFAWNVLKNFAIFWTVLMAGLTFLSLIHLSDQAHVLRSGAEQAGYALGAMMGFGFIGALWFFPLCGALILGLFLKQSTVEEGPKSPQQEKHPRIIPLSRMKSQ